MTFDVVICTYNRPQEVIRLINEIKKCELTPAKIIVVDSSEKDNSDIGNADDVIYVKSAHKNQPYQRFLGSTLSQSELITFFDDDLMIRDNRIFNYLLSAFEENGVVGACTGLEYEVVDKQNGSSNDNNIPVILSKLLSIIRRISIGKRLQPGEMWLLGMDTPKNEDSPYVEYTGGGDAPTFKRGILSYLFDDFLFSLYENGLGKGEDKYFSMKALVFGKIRYINRICLLHPPVGNSHYFKNLIRYRKNSMRTRLILSLRYAGMKGIFKPFVYLHYSWFAFWTFIYDSLLLVFQPGKRNLHTLYGNLSGYFCTMYFMMVKRRSLGRDIDWQYEVEKDKQQVLETAMV
ncbi:MAG: glycosyltransferase family 2 protein [Chlorobi bacterium]|nr:glycosyltransferase family 2 protein [Chlorobiota bacterium]